MKKWFSLVVTVALVSIGSSLQAGIFDRLVQDTSVESIPLTDGGGDVVEFGPESHLPPPMVNLGDADLGSTTLGFGYPFKTDCCVPHNYSIKSPWRGYCHGAKGGCSKGHCGHRTHGKKGCSTGKCDQSVVAYRKGHVQQSPAQRTHVQRSHVHWGHVQHGKGASDCRTCGTSPCGCHAKSHRQKSDRIGCRGKSCGKHGCKKGHAPCDCGKAIARHGKGAKHSRASLFGWWHHCGTCGKSTIAGFTKGGCDCGAAGIVTKGWSPKGVVNWGKGHSMDVPFGHPTPAFAPPVELQAPVPVDALPVPETSTGYSAFMQRLPRLNGSQY